MQRKCQQHGFNQDVSRTMKLKVCRVVRFAYLPCFLIFNRTILCRKRNHLFYVYSDEYSGADGKGLQANQRKFHKLGKEYGAVKGTERIKYQTS